MQRHKHSLSGVYKMLFRVALLLLVVSGAAFASEEFSYDAQSLWPGFCESNTGRQSPINIVTKDVVVVNEALIELELQGYGDPIGGTFSNTGHNQQFDPSEGEATRTLRNNFGTYDFVQVHMHWGARNGVGSEHRVHGSQYDLELHFVHRKKGNNLDNSAGDYYSVVGVFAKAVSDFDYVSRIWGQLPVQPRVHASVNVSGILLEDFLPPKGNRNYYQYNGSLTTPNCDETVQWFVFKTPIAVPQYYLDALRTVRGTTDVPLDKNYRDVQALNGRKVYTMDNSGETLTEASMLLLLFRLMGMA